MKYGQNTATLDKPVAPVEELLTIHEVARRLRVDDTTVRRWINNGALEAVSLPHLGKRRGYRVKKSTMARLMGVAEPVVPSAPVEPPVYRSPRVPRPLGHY